MGNGRNIQILVFRLNVYRKVSVVNMDGIVMICVTSASIRSRTMQGVAAMLEARRITILISFGFHGGQVTHAYL